MIIDSVILCTSRYEDTDALDQSSDFFVKKTQIVTWNEIVQQLIVSFEKNDSYDDDIDYHLQQFLSFKKQPEIDLDFCRAIRL